MRPRWQIAIFHFVLIALFLMIGMGVLHAHSEERSFSLRKPASTEPPRLLGPVSLSPSWHSNPNSMRIPDVENPSLLEFEREMDSAGSSNIFGISGVYLDQDPRTWNKNVQVLERRIPSFSN